MMPVRFLLIFWILFEATFSHFLSAQSSSPYHLSVKRDVWYVSAGVGTMLAGEYLRSQAPNLTIQDLEVEEINRFDRIATRMSSSTAAEWSNNTLYSSIALTGTLLLGKESRREFGKITILFLETMALNSGLTNVSKAAFLRPRPYVFDEHWDPDRILSSGDRAAFVSGHTSGSAAGAFFFARVFSDYYPESKLKPYIWVVAAGMPALTGYLRVRAGRHYPTDVMAGYLLGASVGYLVPTLHKKPIEEQKVTLTPVGNGVWLTYRF
jgi:membrane-associated phospholipid phosphatase